MLGDAIEQCAGQPLGTEDLMWSSAIIDELAIRASESGITQYLLKSQAAAAPMARNCRLMEFPSIGCWNQSRSSVVATGSSPPPLCGFR